MGQVTNQEMNYDKQNQIRTGACDIRIYCSYNNVIFYSEIWLSQKMKELKNYFDITRYICILLF